jgi:formamidopyrimidine-DNA glycosylase
MPELPEVEYTRRLLRPAMEGARFEQVILRRANLRYAFAFDFADRLEGQHVRTLTRRAKYLVAELSSGDLLVMHLGMSGSFRVEPGPARAGHSVRETYDKHDHVVFEMSSGSTVIFNDPRRFGFMKVLEGQADGIEGASRNGVEPFRQIGPEPLDRRFTAEVLAGALRGRKTTLKAALLDQRVVAGLGNIYVSEALHRARLSPTRTASTIAKGRLKAAPTSKPAATAAPAATPAAEALVAAIKDTLRDAIAHQHRPSGPDRFLVYDREGERCPRRGCRGTITRITQAGRSTFYCPVCQR